MNRSLPALARTLAARGYQASALNVDTLEFFNYVKAYRDFGFSDARTLRERTDVPLDAAGRVPSDEALVDFVLQVGRERSPYFVSSFTNATHLPYTYHAYLGSDLEILDPLPPKVHDEVKTFVNALRTVDHAIEKLVRSLEDAGDPVVVAVFGDHLPGLSAETMSRSTPAGAQSFVDGLALSHRCPIVLWSNFGAPKRDFERSLNFLAPRLLEEMGSEVDGLWRANAAMAERIPVLSKFVQTRDGRRFLPSELPAKEQALVQDYGLTVRPLVREAVRAGGARSARAVTEPAGPMRGGTQDQRRSESGGIAKTQ